MKEPLKLRHRRWLGVPAVRGDLRRSQEVVYGPSPLFDERNRGCCRRAFTDGLTLIGSRASASSRSRAITTTPPYVSSPELRMRNGGGNGVARPALESLM